MFNPTSETCQNRETRERSPDIHRSKQSSKETHPRKKNNHNNIEVVIMMMITESQSEQKGRKGEEAAVAPLQ